MSRKIHGESGSERITSDGTAARTRPLSIKDIMLRREEKAASESKKAKEGLENGKNKSTHLEQGREHKSRMDPRDMPVEGSRKEKSRDATREGSKKENQRHIPRKDPKKEDKGYAPKEVSKKDNSRDRPSTGAKMDELKDALKVPEKEGLRDAPKKASKRQRPSGDDNHSFRKDKSIYHSQKLGTSMGGRTDESKARNLSEIRERKGDVMRSEYPKEPGRRWNDETVDDDKIKFKSEKLRNETKRKDRSFDNERSSEVDRPMLKKQDSGRFQDSKHSDRNAGRNEYAKPYLGEPGLKRRRSRSRDHDRERYGRSISPQLREQRYNYHGLDFGNYPPYYSMEKSRRKYAEVDKQRSSGSGGYIGGSHQRYESRLGGYSPRKKKTARQAEQETTKTPSKVIQSPEKKSATWDQPPVKANQSNFPTNFQPTVGQVAPTPLSFSAIKDPSTTVETMAGNSLTADSVQLTQATRPLRRLHIENLPDLAMEDKLIDCLNDFLLPAGIKPQRSKPCLSCTINPEKRQAFVEFLTPEDATAALSFDGRSLNGSALRIRRPKEYVETVNVTPKKPAEETALISNVVADSPHKIFIAGIAGVISSEMLMEIVSAFGPLAAYRFLFNNELGGPCAFLEYADRSITSKACAGLNGMMLGGCVLTAVHVFPNSPAELNFQAANEASPFYGIPNNAKSLLKEPTKVLQIENVFEQEEYMLLSKSELEETLEDVRVECMRFGAVKSVNVVEYPAVGDSAAEDSIAELKIECTESADTGNIAKAVSEYSVPINQSLDVHSDNLETKDADLVPESQDQDRRFPSNVALCESKVPVADEDAEPDETQSRAALPTSQHAEADQTEAAVDENKHKGVGEVIGTIMDDDAVEKTHQDSRTSENCDPAEPTDEVEKPGGYSEQCADDVTEDRPEKAPAVGTSDTGFVFKPGSVLVEFMRKEAACIAAHSLHGRRFGNRAVHAGYAPYDLYLLKYSS